MCEELKPSNDEISTPKANATAELAPMFADSIVSASEPGATPVGTETAVIGQEGATAKQPDVIMHVRNFIRRFVFFRDEELYDLVATWIVSTYMTDQFEYVGYLFAHSPEPQSGKSRLLEVLDLLVNNSSGILVSPTEVVLFRTAEGQTQLFDEVDAWTNKDELRSVLNAGFRFGGSVVRMREEGSDFGPKRFPVYGPRALAGIGAKILDATTRDRTFMLRWFGRSETKSASSFEFGNLDPKRNA